jgi:predicted GNAT family N-acyltransferase
VDAPAILQVRRRVFVEEQGVPLDLELDGLDERCVHLLAKDIGGQPIATARMTPDGHIGRMAVVRDWRRRGIGTQMLLRLLELAGQRGLSRVYLNAQEQASDFYARLGFSFEGGTFVDAGIAHRRMVLTL